MWAETMRVISYPFPEVGELNTPVLLLKAPFMEEVSKEIENFGGLVEIVDDNRPRPNNYRSSSSGCAFNNSANSFLAIKPRSL